MPNVLLTETATWTAGIYVPDDADGATRASLETTFAQGLANRTTYLKQLAESLGVKRLRTVADITALKALTGNTDGDVTLVKTRGIYWFRPAEAGAEAQPLYITPDAGTGRWVHDAWGATQQAYGLATVDSAQRIAQPVKGQVLAETLNESAWTGSPLHTTTSTTFVVAMGSQWITFANAEDGDIIEASASVMHNISTNSLLSGQVRLVCERVDGVDQVASAYVSHAFGVDLNQIVREPIRLKYTAASGTGSYRTGPQFRVDPAMAAGVSSQILGLQMFARHLRKLT